MYVAFIPKDDSLACFQLLRQTTPVHVCSENRKRGLSLVFQVCNFQIANQQASTDLLGDEM